LKDTFNFFNTRRSKLLASLLSKAHANTLLNMTTTRATVLNPEFGIVLGINQGSINGVSGNASDQLSSSTNTSLGESLLKTTLSIKSVNATPKICGFPRTLHWR
jgi:hypothetical protein